MTHSPQLSREKADRFRHYRQKWRSIARSAGSIDQAKARKALEQFCTAFGLERPVISFYPGVLSAYREVNRIVGPLRDPIQGTRTIRAQLFWGSVIVIFANAQHTIPLISEWLHIWLQQYGLDQIYTMPGFSFLILILLWGLLLCIAFIAFIVILPSSPLRPLEQPAKRIQFFHWLSRSRFIQQIKTQLVEPISQQLSLEVQTVVYRSLVVPHSSYDHLMEHWCDRFWQSKFFSFQNDYIVQYELLCPVASYLDFCISELGCTVNSQQWQAVQDVLQTCGWIVTLEKQWIVCDRPSQFNFDQNYQFHAEGKPAIEYADGFKFYAHHGVELPEQYGSSTPREWKAQWLMTERNAEIRRLLIQEIGYDRICQELEAIVIDSWREYILIQCSTASGYEPFVFLKMTCPSTHYVHVLPVPPTLASARAAIQWVNWGIDPEDFLIES